MNHFPTYFWRKCFWDWWIGTIHTLIRFSWSFDLFFWRFSAFTIQYHPIPSSNILTNIFNRINVQYECGKYIGILIELAYIFTVCSCFENSIHTSIPLLTLEHGWIVYKCAHKSDFYTCFLFTFIAFYPTNGIP